MNIVAAEYYPARTQAATSCLQQTNKNAEFTQNWHSHWTWSNFLLGIYISVRIRTLYIALCSTQEAVHKETILV